MRHFGDLRTLDGLGESADYSLAHGAIELVAEQVLANIATFEAEKAAKRDSEPLDEALSVPHRPAQKATRR
jgi:hypothetical protein